MPHYCKIDTEGHELEVIKGLSVPIPFISIEYHLSDENIVSTLETIKTLAKLGEISMNITHGEKCEFFWDTWLNFNEFIDAFPSKAPRSKHCGFGDIFIKMK